MMAQSDSIKRWALYLILLFFVSTVKFDSSSLPLIYILCTLLKKFKLVRKQLYLSPRQISGHKTETKLTVHPRYQS
jgi:hypothetical protein